MPEQIARQSAVGVNLSSGFSRNTPVRFAVAHLLCYGLRREKVEMISAGGHFPLVPIWNFTTRGRHIKHRVTTFCVFCSVFA
jgi:hypothetical protein